MRIPGGRKILFPVCFKGPTETKAFTCRGSAFCCFCSDEECSQERSDAKRDGKRKSSEKKMHEWWRIKSCTFVFNFRQRSLKPNQSARAGGPNWHETCSYPPTSPRSAVLYNNIFFHRQRACLIAPFIREEARLRSASLPPVPTAVAVCLRHHTLCSLARGT